MICCCKPCLPSTASCPHPTLRQVRPLNLPCVLSRFSVWQNRSDCLMSHRAFGPDSFLWSLLFIFIYLNTFYYELGSTSQIQISQHLQAANGDVFRYYRQMLLWAGRCVRGCCLRAEAAQFLIRFVRIRQKGAQMRDAQAGRLRTKRKVY